MTTLSLFAAWFELMKTENPAKCKDWVTYNYEYNQTFSIPCTGGMRYYIVFDIETGNFIWDEIEHDRLLQEV
jgi:hypothetical protein